ncbi:hypothetical protein [Brunnivagina elsteri]|uniref:hypothetical protein n=1 Tax=Brunnivagina elsteri TaxID=1247191 RepID=UPI0011784A7D|nr:hypothetical protein [Calothrix elsteri]
MTICPCCSSPLLRYVRNHQVTLFCRNCWQEMPILTCEMSSEVPEQLIQMTQKSYISINDRDVQTNVSNSVNLQSETTQ